MSELELQKLELLLYLFKWLMGIFGLCIPVVIGFFVALRKDINRVGSAQALQADRLDKIKESHQELKEEHAELRKYVYTKN